MAKLTTKRLPSPAAIALRQAAAEAERLAADLRRRADLIDGAAAAGKKPATAKKAKRIKAKKARPVTAKKVKRPAAKKRQAKKAPRRAPSR